MNYRKATIYSRTDATTAKTESIDLDLTDIISRLQVRFEGINSTHVPTAHPAKQISKMEIVDGSDVLFSMNGMETEAMDFYDTDKSRSYEIDYRDNMFTELVMNMNFGRRLFDPLLAFDCGRFKNPQLKITHDKALGGSLPDAAYLTVTADVFDEKMPSPMGFLLNKEFNSYTPVASSYKTVDMPDDYLLRKILIKALYSTNTWTDNIDEVRLDENNLKRIPLDSEGFLLLSSILNRHPLYDEIVVFYTLIGSKTVYVTPCEYPAVSVNQSSSTVAYVAGERGGGSQVITDTEATLARMLVKGRIPHGCLPIEFGDQQDLNDWYDITKIKDLNLRLHHASGIGGTVEIVTQQLRKY